MLWQASIKKDDDSHVVDVREGAGDAVDLAREGGVRGGEGGFPDLRGSQHGGPGMGTRTGRREDENRADERR
jgi:hypothetical protein